MGSIVQLLPADLGGPAGEQVEGLVRLDNLDSQPNRFRMAVTGPAAPWAAIDSPCVEVAARSHRDCVLRFLIPPEAASGAAGLPFAVRVVVDGLEGAAVARGRLHIEAPSDIIGAVDAGGLSARLDPPRAAGSRRARARVVVTNGTSAPARVQAHVEAVEGVAASIRPDSMVIEARSSERLRLTFRWRSRFFAGRPRQLTYQVCIEPLGSAPVVVKGQIRQRSRLRAGAPRLAVAALVAMALVVGGMALLRERQSIDLGPYVGSAPVGAPARLTAWPDADAVPPS